MISIAPKLGESRIDELNDSLIRLKKRQDSRNNIFLTIIALIWIPVGIALFRNLGAEVCGGWFGLSIVYFIVVPFLYYFIQSKTRLRLQINQLSAEIDLQHERIGGEREEKAIKLLSTIKLQIEARKIEMLEIEAEIKYKRKWREEFNDFPLVLERNRKLDQLAHNEIRRISEDVRKSHPEYTKWNRKYLYTALSRGIFWPFGYVNYRWLEWRLESMKVWAPPESSSRTYLPRETVDRYDD